MTMHAKIKVVKLVSEHALGAQIERPVNNLTNNVAIRMRRLVPKRSFRLHDTIEAQPAKVDGGRVVGTVTFGGKVVRGKYVGYHLMVERGTSKMAAQPFARPALYQSRASDLNAKASKK